MDAVRYLRAVGSVHARTGKKITGITFTNDRYNFVELFKEFCFEDWDKEQQKQKEIKNKQDLERKKRQERERYKIKAMDERTEPY